MVSGRNYLFPVGLEGESGSRRDLTVTPQDALEFFGRSYGVRLDGQPNIFPPTSNAPTTEDICEINPDYHWEITDTANGNSDVFTAAFQMDAADVPYTDSLAVFDASSAQWIVVPNQNAVPFTYTADLTFDGASSQRYYAGAAVNPNIDDFSWLPDFPNVSEPPIRVGDTVQFFANVDDMTYNWQFGEGGTALAENPQYVYDREGRYDVDLTIIRQDVPQCFASGTKPIKVLPVKPLFLPTAFSPNEDILNEAYTFSIENMEYVNFQVFNRWGRLIFEDRFEGGPGAEVRWDGTDNGETCQEGVYVYVAEGVNAKNGNDFTQSGSITLIR